MKIHLDKTMQATLAIIAIMFIETEIATPIDKERLESSPE